MAGRSEVHKGNDHSVSDLSGTFTFYHNTTAYPLPSAGSFLMHDGPACGDASRLDDRGAAFDAACSIVVW